MLRGDPVRGDCCAGRRMDEAIGIMGVFLLEPYNPVIVYQGTKDKKGVSQPPIALPKPTGLVGHPKSHADCMGFGHRNVQRTSLDLLCEDIQEVLRESSC